MDEIELRLKNLESYLAIAASEESLKHVIQLIIIEIGNIYSLIDRKKL